MSVLVWDGSVLATDSFANNGNIAYPYEKIWKAPDGNTLFGTIGKLEAISELRQWADTTYPLWSDYPVNNQGTLIAITKEKGLVRYKPHGVLSLHGNAPIAFGDGADTALGALHMGATAEQAVAAAIKYNIHCNGEVKSIGF